ncbi:hypothetical protein LCGC14_2531890 [marine sediment metagenome]|uniref:Uncharacterized protein n=1 Tax=marine sediment metagenome TaxID=412755 RepID=A0A0F9ATA7_9ZZZZ
MSETHVEEPERLRLELNQVRVALEQATAKITTLEADRKKEWDARTVTENKLNERIEQLEAKLERCIWGGHAQDRHTQKE